MPCFRHFSLPAQQTQAPVTQKAAQQSPPAVAYRCTRNVAHTRPPAINRVRTSGYAESSIVSELPVNTPNEVQTELLPNLTADVELAVLIDVLPARVQASLKQRSHPSQVRNCTFTLLHAI